ncbi:glycosyltransferase [Actinoplanes sp. NBC_00393]|uniref:glycosyltransferase family 2 protein n=1 Tax=Actinoplanes sp. NBC_00393 TaxID=2975953 RepID=UPI002E223588
MTGVSVVIPTLGRPSLHELLRALGPLPESTELIVVDDRADRDVPLELPGARILPGRAAGPAAARNIGWRAARHEWVAFLDDDVLPDPGWAEALAADLDGAGPQVGGVQARLHVPLPADRRPTDWERVTAGLADGEWITADMAYRRAALARVGGFDERLPRAFREDAELAHRIREAGWELRRGLRSTTHPVRPERRWVSVRTQRGNTDDALLRRLYGPDWRDRLGIPPGRRHRHAAITLAGAAALACGVAGAVTGRRSWSAAAAVAGAAWAAGTAEFAAARIAPGPRDAREVTTMLLTSAAIPPMAITHWVRGWLRWRSAQPMPAPAFFLGTEAARSVGSARSAGSARSIDEARSAEEARSVEEARSAGEAAIAEAGR